jgi:hypothetical protein
MRYTESAIGPGQISIQSALFSPLLMTVSTIPPTPSPSDSETLPSSEAVLCTYTAPTCKLEISANSSPLARWTQKPTLKNQRFNLNFNDPRVGEDQWTVLRGDRIKLESLTNVVTDYVQTFLTRSQSLSSPESEGQLTGAIVPALGRTTNQGITLQPKGLLAHTLTLGMLATETTGSELTLSSTQLADLASVLDEHSAATIALPTLKNDFAWTRSPAVWGKIAAGTLMSLGVTATVLNQFNKPQPQQIASTSASSNDQRTAPTPLPLPPTPSPFNLPGQAGFPPIGVPTTTPSGLSGISAAPNGATADGTKSGLAQPGGAIQSSSTNSQTTATQSGNAASTTNAQPEQGPRTLTGTTTEIPEASGISAKRQSTTAPKTPTQYPVSPIPTARRPADGNTDAADPAPPDVAVVDRSTQIGEIQDRVKALWKPTAKNTEELNYLMEVDATGKLLSIDPQSESAKKALSSLPVRGVTIASPLPAGNKPYKVRLVLSSDGSVTAIVIP